jgi:thiol:disulfide interchange protein DsbD
MRRPDRICTLVLLLLTLCGAFTARAAEDPFLPPEQVFKYTLTSDGANVAVHWSLPSGYYAYKSRMSLESATPGMSLGAAVYPQGEVHKDDYFGAQEVFRGAFIVTAAVSRASHAPRSVLLKLKIQGCADAGLCYPPQLSEAKLDLPGAPASRPGAGIDSILGAHRQGSSAGDFLPADEAFRFDGFADGPDRARLVWQIAEGYYLYRSRLSVQTTSPKIQLGRLALPAGTVNTDEYFGKQEIYQHELVVELPVARAAADTATDVALTVTYQGCAQAGLCYPPITKMIHVSLPRGGTASGAFVSEQERLATLVRTGSLLLVLGTFFGLGLLLGFTPCVLPMVPILSGIIVGQGPSITTRRAFTLSLTYVLGMALTYTVAGAAFAAFGHGQQAQAIFQQPWIIALFAAVLIALALSMFGLFTLQMPAAVQTWLSELSSRQSAGTFGGVAVMGALSALIVTTCVAPALVAILAVIAQSGDIARGAATLFALSFGMGTPLLVAGASAGKLLPKAGAWMDIVKRFFGVLMLAVAAWMLTRIVPAAIALVLWALPALLAAWVLWPAARSRKAAGWLLRGAGVALGLFGVVLLVGASLGGTDPLEPIPRFAGHHQELPFRTIKSLEDLRREVARAKSAAHPVLLDFYADWCVSCKEMERYTFSDPKVQTALHDVVLLRADVTRNDAEDQALLAHFGIFGPPTIAFYGADGEEQRNFRVVGYMKAAEFGAVARQALFGAANP